MPPQMTKGETIGFAILGIVLLIASIVMLKLIDPHNDTMMGLTLGVFISSIVVYFMILAFGDIYKGDK